MKYFIGVQIPHKYKKKIELLRAEFRFFTTEPHITLIPPPALPDNDDFINQVIKLCQNTNSFKIRLGGLGQFGNRVLYVNVHSEELALLHNKIYDELNLIKENRTYTPHLTIVKQRPKRPVNINEVRNYAEKNLISPIEFTLNSIVVYHQPKEKSIYVPYMEIPLYK